LVVASLNAHEKLMQCNRRRKPRVGGR